MNNKPQKTMFLAAMFWLCGAIAAYATPPSDIIITFDTDSSIVKARIIHKSEDPTDHFIYLIYVSVNGKNLIKQTATRQTNADEQDVMYMIPGLKPGDRVSVDAECNKWGELVKEAVVPPNEGVPVLDKKSAGGTIK